MGYYLIHKTGYYIGDTMYKGMKVKFWLREWFDCEDSYDEYSEEISLCVGTVLDFGEESNVLIAAKGTEYFINIDDILEEVL